MEVQSQYIITPEEFYQFCRGTSEIQIVDVEWEKLEDFIVNYKVCLLYLNCAFRVTHSGIE